MKSETDKIAIFIDVENLTKWIADDGPEKLLDEICSIGQPIVRRAYGNWNSTAVTNFQASLNRLGFELVHNFHPVSGKNSSDIQMTVDVIEYAWNLESLSWFVLATGDSDFSPLFRRLREMGKGVIGVGPRSTLSETVKTSCSRYIYTQSVTHKGEMAIQSAYEDAVDNVERILSIFEDKVHLSLLKQKLLNLDSAFNEKQLGFSSFSAFIESIESVSLNEKSTSCHLLSNDINNSSKQIKPICKANEPDITSHYRSFLRKKNWRTLPKDFLVSIFEQVKIIKKATKEKMLEEILSSVDTNITPTDVRKALAIFMKCQVLKRVDIDNSTNQIIWEISDNNLTVGDMLRARDIAVTVSIAYGCHEEGANLDNSALKDIMFSAISEKDVNNIIEEAKKNIVIQ